MSKRLLRVPSTSEGSRAIVTKLEWYFSNQNYTNDPNLPSLTGTATSAAAAAAVAAGGFLELEGLLQFRTLQELTGGERERVILALRAHPSSIIQLNAHGTAINAHCCTRSV